MAPKLVRKDPWSYVETTAGEELDPRGERLVVISAAGCGELLKDTGYRHGQVVETDLDGALHVVRKLHEHGLDVQLGRMSCPFLQLGKEGLSDATEIRNVRCIWVVPVNWYELAGAPPR